MATLDETVQVDQSDGQQYWILGQLLTFKLHDESDTVGMFEMEIPPGGGAPAHLHRGQDETHYVIDGTFRFTRDGETLEAGPGAIVYVPRGMVHAFANDSDRTGRLLFVETPAGPLEEWLQAIGDPVDDLARPPQGEPDMEKLGVAAERTGGIEFVEE